MKLNMYRYTYNNNNFNITLLKCESKKDKNSKYNMYKHCTSTTCISECDLNDVTTLTIDYFVMYSLSSDKIEYFMNSVLDIRNKMIDKKIDKAIESKMKRIEILKNNKKILKSIDKVKLTLEEIKTLYANDIIYIYDIDENGNEYNEKTCSIETRTWGDYLHNPNNLYINDINVNNQINKDIKDYNKTWTAYKYKPTYL